MNFNQRDLDLVGARERMTEELLKGRLNPEWRMANWVNVQTNINEIEYKGKRKETVQKVEKIDHRRKKEDNGGKNRVVKSRAKIESKPKEKPKAMSKETNLEIEQRLERINWPKGNSSEWTKFDDDVSSILKHVHSSYESKVETELRIIYTVAQWQCVELRVRRLWV